MAKPKAQTLQQKLGFFDDDIKKPKHDELMLWLDSNIPRIINELFNCPLTEQETNSLIEQSNKNIKEVLEYLKRTSNNLKKELNMSDSERRRLPMGLQRKPGEIQELIIEKENKIAFLEKYTLNNEIPAKPTITRIKKTWELPVTTATYSNKYTIGFIDFAASFNVPVLEFAGLRFSRKDNFNTEKEYYDFDEKILGFTYYSLPKTIYIEVKTEINSLGDLIRQINQYKTYLVGDYYVLCPDSKYKELLQEQGIKFIEQT